MVKLINIVSSLVMIFTLVFGLSFTVQNNIAHAIELGPENTLPLCSDGLDNDDDTKIDLVDPDCSAFVPPPPTVENTLALCTDTLDNDLDSIIDLFDSDCGAFDPNRPAPRTNGGYTSGGGGSVDTPSLPTSASVLGAATTTESAPAPLSKTCEPIITQYLKKGQNNPVEEVKKLQLFLNNTLGLNLPVNGIFDDQTENAVKALQLKYSADILVPWVKAGIMSKPTPTGYVYKTTKWYINNTMCGGGLPMPLLP